MDESRPEVSNDDLQVMHEYTEEGYRITAYRKSDGVFIFSWLMDPQDAHNFANQILSTLVGQ